MSVTRFNPRDDKIAIVVKEFTLLKSSEIFLDKDNEPYIVSFAVDQDGAQSAAFDLNIMPFPNVMEGDTISFDGQGHIVYGPKNPGEFVVYSLLFMESDQDLRDLGATIEDIVKSEAANIAMKAILVANPTYGTALALLQKLTELVAKQMKRNKDDQLYRRNGTLLRDVTPPFDILRTYKGRNKFIECHTSIIPLMQSNNLGSQMKRIHIPE
ncbi:MAG: hypothetical protein KAV87_22025 [Desulfobacteraceae bacterium]|nr:hypothetical protein [Desulfobacteraceae bacterium]